MRITILLVLITFVISAAIIGCSTAAKDTCPETSPIIFEELPCVDCDDNSNLLTDELLTKCLVDKSNSDLKWKSYLWHENYYDYYPTGCKNPKNTFTMCKDGCHITYYCDTNSMNPLFYCNARLELAECSSYSVGDIVLVKNKERIVNSKYDYYIHQIVRIADNQIITKGFNNNGIDGFNSSILDIKGKVIRIEY